MSDLISRSELLESFRKSYCFHLGMENSDGMITFRSICRIINEQPTAYDIDKIVEELEERQQEYLEGFGVHDNNELYGVACGLGDAIKIVKHSGVSDDVCEWKMDNVGASIGCRSDLHHTGYVNRAYCPYCGKKIKVVE